MCPDPQILSIYLDGELPSPWKEKMGAHLAACPKCKERLENYKHVQELFRKGASNTPIDQKRTIVNNDGSAPIRTESGIVEILEDSKEKVWKKLASRQRYSTTGLVRKSGNIRNYSVWRRRISIPLPIVAAAAALFVIFTGAFLPGFLDTNKKANQIEYANFTLSSDDVIPMLPVGADYMQDMNSVLQYLDNGTDIIILQLPESRNFSRSGEPTIIRSADYSSARRGRP
ncbi:MAG: hypothetical protein LBU88_09800 [Treponema sp.]|jgi:hypothetical protein|nr:hypothetical protein [Treponema sp.]